MPTGWPDFTAARSRAIGRLRGRVLEIGAGRGANFADLTPGVEWVGLEPSRRFRDQLTERARHRGHHEPPLAAAAEEIPLPDASVDAVLATTVLCSVRDPTRVLAEIERVLIPGGSVVLAEHVAASPKSLARRLQGLIRPCTHLFDHGCDPTRDTERAVRASRLHVEEVSHHVVPVVGRLAIPWLVLAARSPGA
ncbi:MAG: class I SAM-dependent methyltransferase [Propionibacteriaceae bacterium]